MGIGWSQDEDSQAKPSEEHSDSESHNCDSKAKAVKKPKEGKSYESKANRVEKKPEPKLPHEYEAILKHADSPIDKSSMDKLYDQLYAGVFLNQRRKKYWVEKRSNKNCFMIFARDLSITWAEDNRFWHWSSLKETSDVLIDAAELLNVCWLEVHGKLDTTKLSPGSLYEVALVIMLEDFSYGWEVPVNIRLTFPNGNKQEHKESLITKPKGQWIEIRVGEFRTSPENVGEIEIYMYEYERGEWKRGLVIKGIVVRPKI